MPRACPLVRLAALLTAFFLAFAAAASAAPPPIVIGGTVSLSGKFAETSHAIHESCRLWERQVNQEGGLLDRPVRLLLLDDKSDADEVGRLYRRLIDEDKVDLLVSPYSTTLTLAALAVSEPRGRLMIGLGASGDEIWSRGHKWIFGVYSSAERYFLGFMDMIARRNLREVALIHADSEFPRDAARGARSWIARFGLRLVQDDSFRDGPAELPELARRARAAGAKALVLAAYTDSCYQLLAELKAQDWRPRALAMTVGPAQADFAERAGDLAEGVFGPSQWEPNLRIPFPGMAKFIAEFQEQSRRLPSYHAASAYAGLTIAAKAISQTGGLDQGKLRDFIWALDTVTIMGRFKLDPTGRQVGHSPFIIQWQGMTKEIVYPPRMQTAAPEF